MPYAPSTFTEADSGIVACSAELTSIMDSIRTAIERLNASDSRLSKLAEPAPVGYMDHINYINAQALAVPSDLAFQDLKRHSDKLSGDFATVQTYVQALIAAIESV